MSTAASIQVPKAVTDSLRGHPPTDEQWAAISMPLEPFVIIAGAGSGKTAVMAARVVYLASVALGDVPGVDPSEGAMPGSIMCLTFTNKATENLAARVRDALESLDLAPGEEPVVANYHSYAADLLRRNGLLVGIEPQMQLLDTPQRNQVAQMVLNRMDFFHADATKGTLPGNILKLAEQLSNHLVSPERQIGFATERLAQLEATSKGTDKMKDALRERLELAHGVVMYEQIKRELGAMDFGDQIRSAVTLVRTHPEIAAAERARFSAVLLDEFQDTNHAQAVLLQTIFGNGYPVTAVGDPDQNIYAWRGASLQNLIRFPQEFPRADGTDSARLPLYTNFRSGAHILEAADQIVRALPLAQRPDPDKQLVPWPDNGDGAVELSRFRDEWQEVAWIADTVVALKAQGHPLAEIGVLSRKSRLFASLQQVFRQRGIPVEIIGLAGLLQLPEVQEILSYARATADASAGVSIARILTGPRYRVGYKDLAKVAQWADSRNRDSRDLIDEDDGLSVELAEALTHVTEIEGLSNEGRERLAQFEKELRELQIEARRPVPDFLAEIIRRIDLLTELDAHIHTSAAAATKRNLAAFLDQVQAITPLEGELTLAAFLAHVAAAEAEDRPEWSPAQPSDDESVKIMTVHQAKGLEFDTVFVPGLAQGLLPDTSIQQNPAERGYSMDFELRGDADAMPTLPAFGWKAATFRQALQDQERYEERRTCYVALTRARKQLFVTAAWFYGVLNTQPKKPSELFEDLVTWANDQMHATVSRDEGVGEDEDPLAEHRMARVRPWPGPAQRPDADGTFPSGWRTVANEAATAAAATVAQASPLSLEQTTFLDQLSPSDRAAFDARARQIRDVAAELIAREDEGPDVPSVPTRLSPSSIGTYVTCPQRFYWDRVRPLPRFSSAAARLGTRIHAWIEHRSIGQGSLLDPEFPADLSESELHDTSTPPGESTAPQGPGDFQKLQQNFTESRLGPMTPLYAERAFVLSIDGFSISGRIDAIYGDLDGAWEIVDYKSGGEYDPDDADAWLQLELYALAAADIWGKDAADITMTYFFLKTGRELTKPIGDLDAIRERIRTTLAQVASAKYQPTPSSACWHCDFKAFCRSGQEWVSRAG